MPAIGFRDYGTAQIGRQWEAPTLADFTGMMWDDLDDAEKRRIASHFVWSDSEGVPERFTDLGGGHHIPAKSGVGAAVFRAVSSGRMAQASWFDQAGVKSHLASHYHQFDRQAPWERENMAKDFRGVELFKTGTWTDSKGRKNTWTTQDLDGIANAYKETSDDVHTPLKLGHDDKQRLLGGDDAPAIGWVENVRRVGNRLLGDFMKVPDVIAKLIEEGAYRARSVELSPDFKAGDKTYKWLLTGVALLGSRLPAVAGLSDIVALYQREGIEHEDNSELVYFEGEEEDDDDAELETVLEDLLGQLNSRIKGRRGAPHVRALETALRSAISATKGRGHSEQVDKKKLIELLGLKEDATDEEIETAIKKASHSDSEPDKEVAAKLSAAEGRILELEKGNAVAAAERVVNDAIAGGKLLPAQKEFALNFALRDAEGFGKFVEAQPNVVEFGERGTQQNDINYAKYQPTANEIVVAKQLGEYSAEWTNVVIRQKAEADGVTLPADFGKAKA